MKRALAIATILAAAWTATGAADGGGASPGESFGLPGVVGSKGTIRYQTVPAGRATLLEAVGTRGGQILRWRYLKGSYGVPLVAYDGSGGGLARNGRRLVLVSHSYASVTRFLVVDPRTLKPRAHLRLKGNWAFDALSPAGSLMYLIQYLGVPDASGAQHYAVRALNLNTRRLYEGAIVDRREPDEKMTGIPLTRVESGDGGWAYTFYSRTNKGPFVHALDTVNRRAFCIDVPWHGSQTSLWRVRMRTHSGKLLLRLRAKTIATVDTKTFEVSR
jgi:hypothetical protein